MDEVLLKKEQEKRLAKPLPIASSRVDLEAEVTEDLASIKFNDDEEQYLRQQQQQQQQYIEARPPRMQASSSAPPR